MVQITTDCVIVATALSLIIQNQWKQGPKGLELALDIVDDFYNL